MADEVKKFEMGLGRIIKAVEAIDEKLKSTRTLTLQLYSDMEHMDRYTQGAVETLKMRIDEIERRQDAG
jgi:hypothetical protein